MQQWPYLQEMCRVPHKPTKTWVVLRGLLAIAENYPDLKANQNFLELQTALQNIEGDLGNARRYYNATVRDYNTSIQQFPGVMVANLAGFKPREFYELENKLKQKM